MQDTIKNARTIERAPDGRIRKGFSPPSESIKVWTETMDKGDGDEIEITKIRVPVSSTGRDRDGDRFSEEGLAALKEQYDSGEVPMFPNHGLDPETGFPEYRFEHQMGGWKAGEIVDEGDSRVLYATGALSPENEEAAVLERQIENGVVPVSFSVGFMPTASEPITNDEGEQVGREFHAADLFETSPVGIPSNTDATIAATARAAAKGHAVAKGIDDPDEIRQIAEAVEAEVKAGGSFEEAISEGVPDTRTDTMQDTNTYDVARRLASRFIEAGGEEEAPLKELLTWADENDRIEQNDASSLSEAADELREELEADSDEPLAVRTLIEKADDDDEGDEGDEGDEDEGDEDDEEEEGVVDAATPGEVREIVRDELQPLREEITATREALEAAISDSDGDGDESEENTADEIAELREELDELREENEELRDEAADLRAKLETPRDPKGHDTASRITSATDPAEREERTTDTPADGDKSEVEEADDDLGHVRAALKGDN